MTLRCMELAGWEKALCSIGASCAQVVLLFDICVGPLNTREHKALLLVPCVGAHACLGVFFL